LKGAPLFKYIFIALGRGPPPSFMINCNFIIEPSTSQHESNTPFTF
jgi:hypothetical protein